DETVKRRRAGPERRRAGQHGLLEVPFLIVQQSLEDPGPGAEPAEHRALAQAGALGQAVHGQLAGALLGQDLAGGGQQVPPVTRGVGPFGGRPPPGDGLAHGPTLGTRGRRRSLPGQGGNKKRGKVRLCLQPFFRPGSRPGRTSSMTTTTAPDRFTTLPDEHTLAATITALEEHGFSVEVAEDLDAARQAVLARIPHGSSVMTNTSVTLQEAGLTDAINDGGPYDSARNKMFALDFATQAQQMKVIGGQPDYALGSVHAITRDGTLVIASASGSQLASYAWGAANVIFVVGAQKLVPTLAAAHERIYTHSLPLEDARAQAAYGQHSQVGKLLEIHQELPGRIHIVLIRQQVGFQAAEPDLPAGTRRWP